MNHKIKTMSYIQKITPTSISFFQKVKTVLYGVRFYLGLALIFIIVNSITRNGFDPNKNFNYIVNRSEKGTLCNGIHFDTQTYSYSSYASILENTLKRANDLETNGNKVIDIQVDTYVSFLSGFAKKGLKIVKNNIGGVASGGISVKKKRKTVPTKKVTISNTKPEESSSRQTKSSSLGFLSQAFLAFMVKLATVENTTSIILYKKQQSVPNTIEIISCKYIKSSYQNHENIIENFLVSCGSPEVISLNFDTFKDVVFSLENTYLTMFYRVSDEAKLQEITSKTINHVNILFGKLCEKYTICSLFVDWKDVGNKNKIGCMLNYYKYTQYEHLLDVVVKKANSLEEKILSIQLDTFTSNENQQVTYVAIFYATHSKKVGSIGFVNYSSLYKYHTEIYSDLSKKKCTEIKLPASKVSINIDSWNRYTENTNVTLFYYA